MPFIYFCYLIAEARISSTILSNRGESGRPCHIPDLKGKALSFPPLNKIGNNKCWRGCGERGTLLHCWWECRLVQPLWRTVWIFLKKLKIELPYDPRITLLGIYPKDTDVVKQWDTCTPMFIAAMSTIAKLWKEPWCPLTDEWIKNTWSINTMEY